MTVDRAVAAFLAHGPLPDENQRIEAIERAENLLRRISAPVTDEEAHALVACFGPDNCFGLAWTLLHLIETAPGAPDAVYRGEVGNQWIQRLNQRTGSPAQLDRRRPYPCEPGSP
ncbi:MAG TPA: hypothetical protein VL551_34590 [Actinospica sp.]|jgi:hypothetical protein|nr:hypothetical protein [Actinospica sp.]